MELLIMRQGSDVQKTFIPTVMKLKVLKFCLVNTFFMELRPRKVKIGFFPIKVSFLVWGVVLPPSTLLQYSKTTSPFYVSKITLYAIFIVFGLQIPSYYVKSILWTKLALA